MNLNIQLNISSLDKKSWDISLFYIVDEMKYLKLMQLIYTPESNIIFKFILLNEYFVDNEFGSTSEYINTDNMLYTSNGASLMKRKGK
jgi:hypothetical protein